MHFSFMPGDIGTPEASISETGSLHVSWYTQRFDSLSVHGEVADVVEFLAQALDVARAAVETPAPLEDQTSGQA